MELGDPYLQPLKMLGQGSFGRVILCKCLQSDKYVCVKRITTNNLNFHMKVIMDEIYIISQLNHPHIVQFIRYFVHERTVNIVMEYMAKGTMRDVIAKTRYTGIPMPNLLRYFCDMLMGVEYLHIRHVFHRDIKPENMLVDIHERIKIADFGISAIYTPDKPNIGTCGACGTLCYMAPEVLHGDGFEYKSDIWSLGCVLYEMCLGYNPFLHAKNFDDLAILICILTEDKLNCDAISSKYSPVWARLCEQMVMYEIPRRISLPQILCVDPSITVPYYRQYFDYKY